MVVRNPVWLVFRWVLWAGVLLSGSRAAAQPRPPALAPSPGLRAAGQARAASLLDQANLAIAHMDERALAHTQTALRAARATGNPVVEGEAYTALGRYYEMVPIDADRARPPLQRAQRLLSQGPPAAQARNSMYLLDIYNTTSDDYPARRAAARRYYHQGLAQARAAHDPALEARLHTVWGTCYLSFNLPDSALQLARRTARQARQQHLPLAEAMAYEVAAKSFRSIGDWAQADYYARQALVRQQRHDTLGWELLTAIDMLDLLSHSSDRLHQYQRALYYLHREQRLVQRYHVANQLPILLLHRGYTYRHLHQFDSAAADHRQALALLQGAPSTLWYYRYSNQVGLALALIEQGRLDEARRYATQARDSSHRHGQYGSELEAMYPLLLVARRQRNLALALALTERRHALQDSLSHRERYRLLEEMRARYDTDRAEARVLALTRERELVELRNQRRLLALGLGLVLTLALATAGVASYRRRQQRREQALRQRLAADLHDDVGSLLTRLSMESSLLREGVYPAAEQPAHLSSLVDVSRQALRQMSDVVWSVKSDDLLPGVLNRMREHGYELLPAAGLELDFCAADGVEDAALTAAARQQLYLIYKEALHNAVKHAAGAQAVTVCLTLATAALCLTVQDDGAGCAAPGRPQGHGLANMRRRAEQVGGTIEYRTAPGQGFAVRVYLPLAKRWWAERK